MPAKRSAKSNKNPNKGFTLHPGDIVVFKDVNDTVHAGQLMIRPQGRRLWAALKDTTTGSVHVVPTRDHIIEKLVAVEDLPKDQVVDIREDVDVDDNDTVDA